MTNNLLTDEKMQDIYSEAVHTESAERESVDGSSCFDLLCKMDDAGGVGYVVRKLIDMLRAERAELQERRKADSAESIADWVIYRLDARDFEKAERQRIIREQIVAGSIERDRQFIEGFTRGWMGADKQPHPVVPEPVTVETTYPDVQTNWQDAKMYAEGWNACRAAMFNQAPVKQPSSKG